jgi:hypothetical protein
MVKFRANLWLNLPRKMSAKFLAGTTSARFTKPAMEFISAADNSSLLTDFGKINPCYPDVHGDTRETIFYTGAGRRGDQKLDSFNRAMFNAIETKHFVPLFNKLTVGRWQFLGFWRVMEGEYIFDETQKRMIWKFKLVESKNSH